MSSIPTLAESLAGNSTPQQIGRGRIVRPLADDDDEGDVQARPCEPRLARAPSTSKPNIQERPMAHTALHDGILEQLAAKAPQSGTQLAHKLKSNRSAVKAACKELAAKGKLHGARSKGYYLGPLVPGAIEKKAKPANGKARVAPASSAPPAKAAAVLTEDVNFLIDDVGKLSIVTAEARVNLSAAATKRLAGFIDKTKTFRA